MVLPTPLTPAQVGGEADVGETQALFTQGPHKGTTLLVSMADPNLHQAIAEGSVVVPLPIIGTPPAPQPPVNTVLPVITGTPRQGQTLSVSTGTWEGSPHLFHYQWKADGQGIFAAVTATHVLQPEQVGKTITVDVTADNPGGSTTVTTAPTTAVLPLAPTNTAPPAITGTPEVGQTLTVSNGTWTGSPTFARQWMADGSDIAGATGTTYVLQAAEVGMMITCRVTGTNAGGNAVATSAAVGPVTAAP